MYAGEKLEMKRPQAAPAINRIVYERSQVQRKTSESITMTPASGHRHLSVAYKKNSDTSRLTASGAGDRSSTR